MIELQMENIRRIEDEFFHTFGLAFLSSSWTFSSSSPADRFSVFVFRHIRCERKNEFQGIIQTRQLHDEMSMRGERGFVVVHDTAANPSLLPGHRTIRFVDVGKFREKGRAQLLFVMESSIELSIKNV